MTDFHNVDIGISEKDKTPFENCLLPLLELLKWHGVARHIRESLPHLTSIQTIGAFVEVMKHLNYDVTSFQVDVNEMDARLMPCLFVSTSGDAMLLIKRKGDQVEVFNGLSNKRVMLNFAEIGDEFSKGEIFCFKLHELQKELADPAPSWLRQIYNENKGLIYNALAMSFFINILAIATPLYVMSIYDRVVTASSNMMLGEFSGGILIAMSGLFLLHRVRAQHLSTIGARFDQAIGNHVFSRLLYLSPLYTETATVGSQVARLKDFDRVREFISGPLMVTFFDLPFIFISLTVIAILGGTLVFVPIAMIVIFMLIGVFMGPSVQRRIKTVSRITARQQEFLLETIDCMRAIKYSGAQKIWSKRFRELSAEANLGNIAASINNAINFAVSDLIMIGSGLAILAFGAVKIINQHMEIGAMIAVMILIWRVLTPIKTIFNTLPRLQQLMSSLKQITRLMSLPPESEPTLDMRKGEQRHFDGRISFYRVSMRYHNSFVPALLGVTFDVEPGEVIGIVGRNGCGKSTLLKVLLGLYQPQAGSVRIDNQDIRQINPIELRESIAYLPQSAQLFYGTIAANLRLANPNASLEELRHAAEDAGILKDIEALPEGFDTYIRDQSTERIASSFQQGLCIARTYLRQSNIMLLDEPATTLDSKSDAKLMEKIDQLRGKVTIIMVTHRPSHLRKMDRLLVFEQGQLVLQGEPDAIIDKIPKELI